MRKIIAILLLSFAALAASAFNGYKSLYLHFDDGTAQSFLLTPVVVIKTDSYQFIVNVGDRSYAYPRHSVVSIKYEADTSALPEAPVAEPAVAHFKVDRDLLLLSGIEGPAILRIHSVDGREVFADNVDQFTPSVNIAHIPAGVYIVTDGRITEKILVP